VQSVNQNPLKEHRQEQEKSATPFLAGDQVKVTARKLAILVLRGGPGAEREVSLAGGQCVANALRKAGHEVLEADIAPDNLSILAGEDFKKIDIVFPVLHGTFGEDGQLQQILEDRRIRFVGSDSQSSRLAMDKYRSKEVFLKAGLLTPHAELLDRARLEKSCCQDPDLWYEELIEQIGLPCVIKPNLQGSSVGVIIARQIDQALEAIRDTLSSYGDCLLEQFISGRETTVGIVGQRALPVLEVKPATGFYDYQAKYLAEDTSYLFDLDLSEKELELMQDQALRAFSTLGCRDLARVDFIRDSQGNNCLLEVNTIPGFTDHSLVPKAAAHMGIGMPDLCDQIVQLAYSRPI